MWGKKAKRDPSKVDTLIARGTAITGDMEFTGVLYVDGTINGDISAESDSESFLTVGLNGKIVGEVSVPNVVIYGQIQGDTHVSEKVELKAGGKVQGDLYYRVMEMNAGAEVNGKMVSVAEPLALGHAPTEENPADLDMDGVEAAQA